MTMGEAAALAHAALAEFGLTAEQAIQTREDRNGHRWCAKEMPGKLGGLGPVCSRPTGHAGPHIAVGSGWSADFPKALLPGVYYAQVLGLWDEEDFFTLLRGGR